MQTNEYNDMKQPKYQTGDVVSEGSETVEVASNPIIGCIHKGMLHLSVGADSNKIFSLDIETKLHEVIWAKIIGAGTYNLRRSSDNFVSIDNSIYAALDSTVTSRTLTNAAHFADGQTYKIITTVPVESGTIESNSVTGPLYTQDVNDVTLAKSGNDITIDFGTVTGGTVSEYKNMKEVMMM